MAKIFSPERLPETKATKILFCVGSDLGSWHFLTHLSWIQTAVWQYESKI